MRTAAPASVHEQLPGELALAVEAEAFWCFERLMRRMEGNFSSDSRWGRGGGGGGAGWAGGWVGGWACMQHHVVCSTARDKRLQRLPPSKPLNAAQHLRKPPGGARLRGLARPPRPCTTLLTAPHPGPPPRAGACTSSC